MSGEEYYAILGIEGNLNFVQTLLLSFPIDPIDARGILYMTF